MSSRIHLTLASVAAVAALTSTSLAFAHGDHLPKHGGQVQMTGETQFELVKTARGVDVYVIDDETPIVASKFTAKMSVTAGGKKSEAPMKAVRGNQFTAEGVKLAPGSKVIITIVDGSGARTFATYNAVK